MWTLISGAMSSVGGLLVMLAVVTSLVGAGAYEEHKLDESRLLKVEAGYKDAEAKAAAHAAQVQKSIDDEALAASQAETAAQQSLAAAQQERLANVPAHVQVKYLPCVPLGLIRVLDAAVLGVPADTLALPARSTDATCASIDAVALAKGIAANYSAANANAEQLNALIAFVKTLKGSIK